MSLSMRERLGLQKSVKQNLAALRGGEVGMRERLSLQKQIKADMAKLGGDAKPEASGPEPVTRDNTSVGDTVEWRNEMGTIPGNFRGITDDGRHAVIVANGMQMTAPISEVFKQQASREQNDAPGAQSNAEQPVVYSADEIAGQIADRLIAETGVLDSRLGDQEVKAVVSNFFATSKSTDFVMSLPASRDRKANADAYRQQRDNYKAVTQEQVVDRLKTKRATAPTETPAHERIKAAIQGGDANEAMRIARAITDKLALSEALVKAGFSIAGGTVEAILAYAWPQMQEKAGGGDSGQPDPKDQATPESLTAQAARGDFNGLGLPEFINKLKEAYSADEDLEGTKTAAVGYLEANLDELEAA